MEQEITRSVPAFVPEALAATQVGVWDYDVPNGIMYGDAIAARLFGHTEAAAEAGLPFDTFCQAVNREDNARAEPLREQLRARGGVLLFEVRVAPSPGIQRWLMIRGSFGRDASGGMRGRGIAIDVTGSQLDGDIKGGSLIVAEPRDALDALDQTASQAIATREAVDRLGDPDRSIMRPIVDALLRTVGRALARRMSMLKP